MHPEKIYFKGDAGIPNNPVLPVVLYRNAGTDDNLAAFFKERFAANGWGGFWTDGIFPYHHFHANAHEALAILSGRAVVRLGGEGGRDFTLAAGDLVILPAGTGHKCLSSEDGFSVMGAYPLGQEDYDLHKSLRECPDAPSIIAAVPLPAKDPLTGADGGAMMASS